MVDISEYPLEPNGDNVTNEFVWVFAGTLATNQNNLLPKFSRAVGGSLTQLIVLLQEAPTGDDLIVEFFVDGDSVGTVTVAAGDTSGSTDLSSPYAYDSGAVLTAEITQIGSINPGTTATMIARNNAA